MAAWLHVEAVEIESKIFKAMYLGEKRLRDELFSM